jgi:hypothetical protein
MFCEGSHILLSAVYNRITVSLQIQNQAILDVFVDKIKIIQLIQKELLIRPVVEIFLYHHNRIPIDLNRNSKPYLLVKISILFPFFK